MWTCKTSQLSVTRLLSLKYFKDILDNHQKNNSDNKDIFKCTHGMEETHLMHIYVFINTVIINVLAQFFLPTVLLLKKLLLSEIYTEMKSVDVYATIQQQ